MVCGAGHDVQRQGPAEFPFEGHHLFDVVLKKAAAGNRADGVFALRAGITKAGALSPGHDQDSHSPLRQQFLAVSARPVPPLLLFPARRQGDIRLGGESVEVAGAGSNQRPLSLPLGGEEFFIEMVELIEQTPPAVFIQFGPEPQRPLLPQSRQLAHHSQIALVQGPGSAYCFFFSGCGSAPFPRFLPPRSASSSTSATVSTK